MHSQKKFREILNSQPRKQKVATMDFEVRGVKSLDNKLKFKDNPSKYDELFKKVGSNRQVKFHNQNMGIIEKRNLDKIAKKFIE